MKLPRSIDVLVLGGGPAGSTVALRLLQYGYTVALVERRQMPRPQVGEALTPGVDSILETIGAAAICSELITLQPHRMRRIWQGPDEDAIDPRADQTSCMVNRGTFDLALLRLAQTRGAECFSPARIGGLSRSEGAWHCTLDVDAGIVELRAHFLLDARGRGPTRGTIRVPMAPPLLALWADFGASRVPKEMRLEARPDCWLWGAPLAGGGYRVMSFRDPSAWRRAGAGDSATRFLQGLRDSRLFAELAADGTGLAVKACSASPHLDLKAWRPGALKLGDAAFALDPLSSTGVEKAMRFSLLSAAVVNTLLCERDSEPIARAFYEERLITSAARHGQWARRFYAMAWPGPSNSFWANRAGIYDPFCGVDLAVSGTLQRAWKSLEDDRIVSPMRHASMPAPSAITMPALDSLVRLAEDVATVEVPCLVNDRIQLRAAITHPGLDSAVAFVEGVDIIALVTPMRRPVRLSSLLELWSHRMPAVSAARALAWLWRADLLHLCAE